MNVTSKDIIERAEALYVKWKANDSDKLDLDRLAKHLHADIILQTHEEVQKQAKKYKKYYQDQVDEASFSGFLYSERESQKEKFKHFIYINRNEAIESPGRYRFTVAHEIGHILYDVPQTAKNNHYFFPRKKSGSGLSYSEEERMRENIVNFFAANLLVPMNQMHKILLEHAYDGTVGVKEATKLLSDTFGVSEPMATLRLKEVYL